MTKTLKAGVIGLGVGQEHIRLYPAIPGVEVKGICDLDPEKLRLVGERFGIADRHADFRRITEDSDIDVVSVCSYDVVHAAQAISAFSGGKHVMIEKPVALPRTEAEGLLRAQQDSGKFISSNLILRSSPRFMQLKGMIEAGDMGEIFYMEGDYIHEILWKITRGWRGKMAFHCVTYGGGIHLIDLMRWLIADEVVEVAAMGNQILTRGTSYQWEDTIVALLRFGRGAMAKNFTTFGPQRTKFHSLNVYGTKRTFINDMPNAKLFQGSEPADEQQVTTPYPGMEKGDLLPDFITANRENR